MPHGEHDLTIFGVQHITDRRPAMSEDHAVGFLGIQGALDGERFAGNVRGADTGDGIAELPFSAIDACGKSTVFPPVLVWLEVDDRVD